MKVVWITGASSGIGKALVKEYTEAGFNVILSARRLELLNEIISEYPEQQQPKLTALYLDLEATKTHESTVKKAWNIFGKIDVFINNGGISQRSLVRDTELDVYRRLMEVNYFGNISLTKALMPYFLSQGSGDIAVVSSLVGKFGTPYRSGYAASKHALHGFYDSLRAEHAGDNVNVTIICPGFIRTQVSVNALTGDGSALNKMDNAQAQGMSPEECAKKMKRAIDHHKREVYIGGRETLGVWLKRFFPGLFAKKLPSVKVR